jgi:Asp-tRNA(Asn)/Glu-tRNA(Gln) amidotransferase C subunit
MREPDSNESRTVTIEDINRLLEVGRFLLSVLTEDETQQLTSVLNNICLSVDQLAEIGNTSVS